MDLPDAPTLTLTSKEAAITAEVRLCYSSPTPTNENTTQTTISQTTSSTNGDNMSGLATLVVMAALLAASSFAIGMLPLFFVFSSQ